jgi:hypothetical protein
MIPCDKKKLATISFIGGASKTLGFRIYNRGGSPIDVSNCTGRFAVIDSVNKYGEPLFTQNMSPDEFNVLSVSISSDETVDLCGKYIYQISIVDEGGNAEEPQQGDLYIYNNIDKDYLK